MRRVGEQVTRRRMASFQQTSSSRPGFGDLLHHCWKLFRGGEERNEGAAEPPTFILKTGASQQEEPPKQLLLILFRKKSPER